MESKKNEIKIANYIYVEAAKGARIYDIILDNKNYDCIEDSQIEVKEFNDMDFDKFFKYMEKLRAKKDETENDMTEFTHSFKNYLKIVINNNLPDLSPGEITHNLLRLSGFYYLFKLYKAKDIIIENIYVCKIEEVIDKFFVNKTNYYNILILLDYLKDMDDIYMKKKKDKFDAYMKILFFLNEAMFLNLVKNYMVEKKIEYPQYSIPLPTFSFSLPNLCEKMKELYNILTILRKTEAFKANKRFEYFYAFRYNFELLDEINYVLSKQNMDALICLDKMTDDIAKEAIDYSYDTLEKTQQKDDLISELQSIVDDEKKRQYEIELENRVLKEQYDKLTDDYKKLTQDYKNFRNICEEKNKQRSNQINNLEAKIKEIRQNYTKQNENINKQKEEIKLLNKDNQSKEETIERISYREIGSRIIHFFSRSQSEEKIKDCLEKKISPTNVNLIIKNIKENLSNYNKYLKENHIDLKYVLDEIKGEKQDYDSLVHDTKKYKEIYFEIMNKRNKQLGEKIGFIISKSKLMDRYVFEKDQEISDSEIFQEFQDFEKILKQKFEGQEKKEDSKNMIDDF